MSASKFAQKSTNLTVISATINALLSTLADRETKRQRNRQTDRETNRPWYVWVTPWQLDARWPKDQPDVDSTAYTKKHNLCIISISTILTFCQFVSRLTGNILALKWYLKPKTQTKHFRLPLLVYRTVCQTTSLLHLQRESSDCASSATFIPFPYPVPDCTVPTWWHCSFWTF